MFQEISTKFPHTPVTLLSPLAEGGGRLAAKVAIEMNFRLVVPLPLPVEYYKDDFENAASVEEFESLRAHGTTIDLPLLDGNTMQNIAVQGVERNKQYAQLGVFLSSYSQILLAIWDGKPSDAIGGTAQVVDFHLTDIMPGMTDTEAIAQQLLGRDENDLVYHIVCSRDQPDGAALDSLHPLETFWLTPDQNFPRTTFLTESNQRVFARMDEFNSDAENRRTEISKHDCDLMPSEMITSERDKRINSIFKTADWLANFYQKRVRRMFLSTHTLAAVMGLAFIVYADVPSHEYMIYVFLLLFGVGVSIYVIAQRGQWHRRYLDYRALAEGLRVQFYWQVAGVSNGTEIRFAHDNFLQKQDIELGWIRNVMRAGSIPVDSLSRSAYDLDAVIRYWLEERPTGQLNYYQAKAIERERLLQVTRNIGMFCLWAGIAVAVFLAFFNSELSNGTRGPLIVMMGVLPLIAGVREAYAHKKADRELVKQYRFMEKIFSNAKRYLNNALSDHEKRAILKVLGDAALDEHAEWILMHRQRPLEHGKL